jgi:hypothetical protein
VRQPGDYSRREFLQFGSILGTMFGWIPWFRKKDISLAGARFQIVHSKAPKHVKMPERHYVLIHGDEQTAREVLTKHMVKRRGTGFLIESKTRTVPIDDGKIDPNRMFSRFGAEANLKLLNPNWKPTQVDSALDLLDEHREHLLNALLPGGDKLLVALHNNGEGYSVEKEAPISDLKSLKQPENPHAFFLCTDPDDYQILSASPYNVVLQQHVRASDDGSLSRRAAARRQRYVNLEVRQGDAARQEQMLAWMEAHLP